jgi:uncharacterized membrane protein YphA (DoxX/SURF4 family)/peroxiredoxin
MAELTLLLRACLFVIFATAALGKLANLARSRETMVEFGVPARMSAPAGSALPFVELVCALPLLINPAARWAALACLCLTLLFTGGVANALRQGRTPACNCFGEISAQPIGTRTLLRNAAIIALAAFVLVAAPGASLSSWAHTLTVACTVAGLALLAAALLAIQLLNYRRGARPAQPAVASATAALTPGDQAPDVELTGADGDRLRLGDLRTRGLPLVLVFASPTCGPCMALLPELARWSVALSERLTLVAIESGLPDSTMAPGTTQLGGEIVMLSEPGRAAAAAYHVEATPTGVALDVDGRLIFPPALGAGAIEQLVRDVLRRTPSPPMTAR